MTDKERLETIKNSGWFSIDDKGQKYRTDIKIEDFTWLIQQAEKVGRYEKTLEVIHNLSVYYDEKSWAIKPEKIIYIIENT